MGFFDNLFDPAFIFDTEFKQRRDIQQLRNEISTRSEVDISPVAKRCDRLELLVGALTKVILDRKLATADEIAVLMQQLDLEDGVEDGVRNARPALNAPTCGKCGHFINPKRATCVYCGEKITPAEAAAKEPPPDRNVICGSCGKSVPLRRTVFTEKGLRYGDCYQP